MTDTNRKAIVLEEYANELAEMRKIVFEASKELREFHQMPAPLSEERQARWNHFFGKKETTYTAAGKLTVIINKIMMVDLKIIEMQEKLNSQEDIGALSPGDVAVLERYRQK